MSFKRDIKPYQFRAVYEYLCDQGRVAHIVVAASYPGTVVPMDFVNDQGLIVLNITPGAVENYAVDNETITFSARFKGSPMDVIVPMGAVFAIHDRDTGEGQAWDIKAPPVDDFEGDVINRNAAEPKEPELGRKEKKSTKEGSHLRVVK